MSKQWRNRVILILVCILGIAGIAKVPVDKGYLQEHAQKTGLLKVLSTWSKKRKKLLDAASLLKQVDAAQGFDSLGLWIDTLPHNLHLLLDKKQKNIPVKVICDPSPCASQILQNIRKKSAFSPLRKMKKENNAKASKKEQKQIKAAFVLLLQSKLATKAKSKFFWKTDELAFSVQLQTLNRQKVDGWDGKSKQGLVHWTSVLPPLIAIFFVLLTKRLILSLLLSLFFGVVLYTGSFLGGIYHTGYTYIWKEAIYQEFSFNIILFTLSLIGMINVCSRNGGVQGVIDKIKVYAATPRSSRIITALLGIVVFFDDYANSILVGNTMRPLTDRYKVSREKLAYLVDSTAAPIAGVALLSTWIGYEVGLIGDLAMHLELQRNGYELFLSSLPFRFYCWMTLMFVFIGVFSNRDFGPMLKAERRAWEEGKLLGDDAVPLVSNELSRVDAAPDIPHRWINAVLPIGLVIVAGFIGLLYSGGAFEGRSLRDALANANSTKVFLYASLLGSALAILLSMGQKLLSFSESIRAWSAGARAMLFAIGILIFAWSMGALAKDLNSAHYLIAMLKSSISPLWVPLLVFIMAAIVSFSTGTSWGTMGILLPTAAPLAYEVGGLPILILSLGAVLDGSIFGDHCSPLSDTTLFSSAATSCDHIDHVKTQVPYAITVMLVASTLGYLGIAHGLPLWISFSAAGILFVGIFYLIGKPTNPPELEFKPEPSP